MIHLIGLTPNPKYCVYKIITKRFGGGDDTHRKRSMLRRYSFTNSLGTENVGRERSGWIRQFHRVRAGKVLKIFFFFSVKKENTDGNRYEGRA